MITTSTHDTKRSEDVRARMNVLSEIPQLWSQQVMRWRRTNAALKIQLEDGRIAPDLNEEYLLYQTLVGSWPIDGEQPRPEYLDRIKAYMEKALHEAKTNLSWINPDPEYVTAVKRFIDDIFKPKRRGTSNFFSRDLLAFLNGVIYHGLINSVSQALLKLTAPGVPDIYQGSELIDLSLVDPDNRRPVDFERRQCLMNEFAQSSPADYPQKCRDLSARITTGEAKLWTTARALTFMRDNFDLFRGGYYPVHAAGVRREHVLSFARQHQTSIAITVAPRFTYTLAKGKETLPLGDVWGDTELLLPPTAAEIYENVLSGEVVRVTNNGTLRCSEIFRVFPCALIASR
jgi:(1->4)-alpha-D-glucan 1-alpha-D-glucosylmutase